MVVSPIITLISLFPLLTVLSALTHNNHGSTQVQSLLISSPPAATIPAFPEQSEASGCPLDLPDELFRGVKAACSVGKGKTESTRRVRCCPVLAAWVYAAYSETAMGRAGRTPQTASYDLPMLPDDSETCVDGFQNALSNRGIELVKPNETCDLVSCFCGIRLHPFSCPEAFRVLENGKLVGDERIKKLETDCLGNLGLSGCSKCLQTLHLLNEKKKSKNMTSIEERSSKMHSKDCKLMGITWLLAKDRASYIHTVSAVLRAMMMSNTNGSDPRTCSVSSYGMPLAVDSSEISGQCQSSVTTSSSLLNGLSISLLYMLIIIGV